MDFVKSIAINVISALIILVLVYFIIHYEMKAFRDDMVTTTNASISSLITEADKFNETLSKFSIFGPKK